MTGVATGFRPPAGLVFGFHPSSRGFGWVAFEAPFQPFDWGLREGGLDKNRYCLKRLEALLDRLKPDVLVMEAYESGVTRRSARIHRLCEAVRDAADGRGIEVMSYTRADIQRAFAGVKAHSRRDIAEAVAKHIDAFRHRLPRHRRRPWETEDSRSALFAAAAVALTYFSGGVGSSENKD